MAHCVTPARWGRWQANAGAAGSAQVDGAGDLQRLKQPAVLGYQQRVPS